MALYESSAMTLLPSVNAFVYAVQDCSNVGPAGVVQSSVHPFERIGIPLTWVNTVNLRNAT